MNPSDPSGTEVEKGNYHADAMWRLLESKFPRTHRLLTGSRFQLPLKRQADYPNHHVAAHLDAQVLLDGLTASRLNLAGNSDRWKSVGGSFIVTNEWLKRGRTTLFVERELGEALKRTDLPDGFEPEDLRWRWDAFRLVLPVGLFREEERGVVGDVPSITVLKVNQGQSFDFHPDFSKDAQSAIAFETLKEIRPVVLSDDSDEDGMGFCLHRRISPDQKWAAPLYSGCKLNHQTLRELANEAPYSSGGGLYLWDRSGDKFVVEVKRFLFNALLYMGSLPEEYEPEKVLRPFKEKKGRWKPDLKAARFLGQEVYRPIARSTGKKHEPTGRTLPGHWRAGHWVRQPYGPRSSLRKLIWVQPYKTLGSQETEPGPGEG